MGAAIVLLGQPGPTSAAARADVRVAAALREGDTPWIEAAPLAVPWHSPARLQIRSPAHHHVLHVVPRPDGFRLTYDRDGHRVVEQLDVPAGGSVLRGSDLGIELRIHVEAVASP